MPKPKRVAVFDFDGTFTEKSIGSIINLIDCILTEKALEQSEKLRKFYLTRAHAGSLPLRDEKKWLSENIRFFVESKLSKNKIRQILKGVKLRDGVRETLEFLKRNNIPVAIVSYGVADFIQAVLHANNISHLVTKVCAAELTYDVNQIVTGVKSGTAVFPSTKGKFSRQFARRFGVPLEGILAVGDSGSDFQLGYLKENRLGIAQDEKEKIRLKQGMAEAVVTKNFRPVLKWLQMKAGHKLIILVGPSAIGKTYWARKLIEAFPDLFSIIKNTTTRKPRDSEDRFIYHFVTKSEFLKLKKNNDFVESDCYFKNYYGSCLSAAQKALKRKHGIFALTPKGAKAWYRRQFEVNLEIVLVKPASKSMLRKNLSRRGIINKQEQDKFIRKAKQFKLSCNIRHRTLVLAGTNSDRQRALALFKELLKK